jgi:NADH-quinone oxidoreductase subunit F
MTTSNGTAQTKAGDWRTYQRVLLPPVKDLHRLEVYEQHGGYEALRTVLTGGNWDAKALTDAVKASGLRGRGGASFPTGLKWTFMPPVKPEVPRFLCCNGDESEPGTFKDRQLLEYNPHLVFEGLVLANYAMSIQTCYLYVRGEYADWITHMERELERAYAKGYVGKNILGTDFSTDIVLHKGAGAYICGEETSLMESLEGKRAYPRIKPPFPAQRGIWGYPTTINNVETLACVPLVLERGPEWFAAYGTEKNGGPKLYSISGHVARPGTYEIPMGRVSLRELIYDPRYAGGMRDGRKLRAVVPGGSSTPVLTADEIDVAMDFDSLAKAGSMLGSAATIVMDDSTCMVWMAQRLTYFYKHESCGKCSPCREGTGWMLRILERIENGQGTEKDLETLWNVTDSIAGKTVCPFGDAAVAPPQSTLKKFREEYEFHVREKKCWKQVAPTFEQARALVGAGAGR